MAALLFALSLGEIGFLPTLHQTLEIAYESSSSRGTRYESWCGASRYHPQEGFRHRTIGSIITPVFYGSPPNRAANPLVQDARFGDERLAALSALLVPSPSSPLASASTRKGGCVRMNSGLNSAMVRVEGFDCLNRDSQNSGITALSALQVPLPSSPSASTLACKGGCVRMKFGLNPATARVEGLDCLNRDRQNSGITAMAYELKITKIRKCK